MRLPPPKSAQQVRAVLEAAGCRYTTQRGAVLAYLEQADHHPTAEQVHTAVRSSLPRISLATDYKALDSLVQARLAEKLVDADGSAHFDGRAENHYHLRDLDMGEIRDLPAQFDADLLSKLDPQLLDRLSSSGFELQSYRLEVLGRFVR